METLYKSKFTVFFDEPFWIGVFERIEGRKLSVCKITFGAEPTDSEIYAFLLSNYNKLKFSKPIKTEQKQKADNLKRRLRNAKKTLENKGIGTKSQQALKKQHEEIKTERKTADKEQKEAEKYRRFVLKQQKRKEKHKGH
ncbi:MAG: YjdF family protein [Clostridia bacterium]|nr:YjdF family protein [Clostridia bacterium]